MPFGLKNAPAIFSRLVVAFFKEYIHKFVEVYFDDWIVFGLLKKHVEALRLMLAKCRKHYISLNLKKCVFCVLLALSIFDRSPCCAPPKDLKDGREIFIILIAAEF